MSTDPSPGVSSHDEESTQDARLARVLSEQHQELNRRHQTHHQLVAYSIADMMRERGISELHLSDAGSDGGYAISGGITVEGVAFDDSDDDHDLDLFEEEIFAVFAIDDLDDIFAEPAAPSVADWIIKAEKYSDADVLADLRRQRDELLSEVAP